MINNSEPEISRCISVMSLDRAQRVVAGGDDHGRTTHVPQPVALIDPRGLQRELCVQGGLADLVGHPQGRLDQVGLMVDDPRGQQHRQQVGLELAGRRAAGQR